MLKIRIECLEEGLRFKGSQVIALLYEIGVYTNDIIEYEELLEELYKEETRINNIVTLCLTGK